LILLDFFPCEMCLNTATLLFSQFFLPATIGAPRRFEVRVERVWKDVVKTFPKGLYGRKTAEKQPSWPPRLPDKTNSFE